MKWLARIWNAYVDWLDRALPKREWPKITLEGLLWNLQARVNPSSDPRYGYGLKLSNSQCADLLAIINQLHVATLVGPTHREQQIMKRLQQHNVALPPFGCTWDRCIVPCESQAEHDGKDFTGVRVGP